MLVPVSDFSSERVEDNFNLGSEFAYVGMNCVRVGINLLAESHNLRLHHSHILTDFIGDCQGSGKHFFNLFLKIGCFFFNLRLKIGCFFFNLFLKIGCFFFNLRLKIGCFFFNLRLKIGCFFSNLRLKIGCSFSICV